VKPGFHGFPEGWVGVVVGMRQTRSEGGGKAFFFRWGQGFLSCGAPGDSRSHEKKCESQNKESHRGKWPQCPSTGGKIKEFTYWDEPQNRCERQKGGPSENRPIVKGFLLLAHGRE